VHREHTLKSCSRMLERVNHKDRSRACRDIECDARKVKVIQMSS